MQPKSTKLKNSPEKAKPKSKKKSVLFPDQDEEKSVENVAVAVNVVMSRTPVASASETRLKIADTLYHSVENCSKCQIDTLETSSYWLGQIKLAESVGKHFVSAAFFRLAFESRAEVCCFLSNFCFIFVSLCLVSNLPRCTTLVLKKF